MSAEHTPGPWKWLPEDHMIETEQPVNLRGEYEHICDFRPDLAGKYHEANARLIAAAPELLEACKAGLCAMRSLGWDTCQPLGPAAILRAAYEHARAAITKATQPTE